MPLRSPSFCIIAVILLATSALAADRPSDDPEPPRPWPERFLKTLRASGERGYVALTSALFDGVDELGANLFDFPGDGRAKIKIHRDVYDNFDLLNTYTVIDRVQLRAQVRPFRRVSTWLEDAQTTGLGMPYASFIFEPQGFIEWVNVRPVQAFELKKQSRLSDLRASAQDFLEGRPRAPESDDDLSEMNPNYPITFQDPSLRAKFSRMLNLVTFPFRLPLARRDLRRMQDGEILGYAFDGQVEVGLGVGMKVIPSLAVLHAGIDIRGTAILRGRYQISVLRESERFARVKLTRIDEKGWKASVQAGVQWKGVYDGMMLFRGTSLEQPNFLRADLRVIPFRWESTRLRGHQFDVVYRYDLESKEGRDAFHRAVLGGFGRSQESVEKSAASAALSEAGTVSATTEAPIPPVERLLSRDGNRLSKTNRVRAELSAVLRLEWNRQRESLEAVLELPDGTHHLHQASRETRKRTVGFFSTTRENRSRRMTLVLDEERFTTGAPDAVFAIAEFTEEDSDTNASELWRALSRMESTLRKHDLLPDIVSRVPRLRAPDKTKRAWHGRSSFYYGYSLSEKEIGEFLRADPMLVHAAAARRFPEETELAEFDRRWTEASLAYRRGAPARELFPRLRALFTERIPVTDLTEILFDSLPGRAIDYFVTAQNVTFGTVQERGKTVTSVERLLTLTDRELGFETYAQRLKQDSSALTRGVRLVRHASGWLELRFELSHRPETVFFRLYRVSGMKRQRRVAEVAVHNRSDRFVVGENRLLLDPESLDPLISRLARDLRAGEFYSISIGFARSSTQYGPVSTARFEAGVPYPPREGNRDDLPGRD